MLAESDSENANAFHSFIAAYVGQFRINVESSGFAQPCVRS